MRLNSSFATSVSMASTSWPTASSVSQSSSAMESSKSSAASLMPEVKVLKLPTISSSNFFSLLISWACFGSFQRSGFSTSRLTSSRRRALRSTSKIPPKFCQTAGEVVCKVLNLIDAFDFHHVTLLVRMKLKKPLSCAEKSQHNEESDRATKIKRL